MSLRFFIQLIFPMKLNILSTNFSSNLISYVFDIKSARSFGAVSLRRQWGPATTRSRSACSASRAIGAGVHARKCALTAELLACPVACHAAHSGPGEARRRSLPQLRGVALPSLIEPRSCGAPLRWRAFLGDARSVGRGARLRLTGTGGRRCVGRAGVGVRPCRGLCSNQGLRCPRVPVGVDVRARQQETRTHPRKIIVAQQHFCTTGYRAEWRSG